MSSQTPSLFCLLLFLLLTLSPSHAQLGVGYYHNLCPGVESIVKSAVKQKLEQTFVTAPATLRLFFHDCFVRVYPLPLPPLFSMFNQNQIKRALTYLFCMLKGV
ncbi:hypothetical protein PVK06_022029 [Gossypium arboreum]|uniref:peroxidase n=1 Tax=Gossypium arboreum TaxID=29729 RepID=A0ABR0P7B6_GOSAR|nr:hypothetical protein PVK06_022029 [Gossypium arboreum]